METTPAHTLNLSGVFLTSTTIIKANSRPLLALSLFFLPLSVSLIITPHIFSVDLFHNFPSYHQKAEISHLLYILIIYVSTVCAIATITYSTYHGFAGKQVNFFTSLKSLTFSIFPVITTAIVAHILLFLIWVTFILFSGAILHLARSLGFAIDYNSIYFILFSAFGRVALIVIIVYFHLNWSLAFVVVVAESKWGFAPLMRSSYLVKGMRWYLVKGMRSVSLLLLLYFGIISGSFAWISGQDLTFFKMITTFFLMLIFLRSTAAMTVLYMYCKALHGELELEIDEGFNHHYINLRSDVEKVPQIVPVVAA